MNDFHVIRYAGRAFRSADARAIHLERIRWLQSHLADGFVGTTIVVTHHLPLRQSIHSRYRGSDLNPAFASDLGDLMGSPVTAWVHAIRTSHSTIWRMEHA